MDSIFNLIYSFVIMVLLMGLVKHICGPHVQRKGCNYYDYFQQEL